MRGGTSWGYHGSMKAMRIDYIVMRHTSYKYVLITVKSILSILDNWKMFYLLVWLLIIGKAPARRRANDAP